MQREVSGCPGMMVVAEALTPLKGGKVPEDLLYLSTCRRRRRDDTRKGRTPLLQKSQR